MMMSGGDANMPGAPGNTGALMNMGMIPGPSGGMGYLLSLIHISEPTRPY